MLGKPVPELKGKTTKPANMDHDVVSVQRTTNRIHDMYYNVMFIYKVAFLIGVAKPLTLILFGPNS